MKAFSLFKQALLLAVIALAYSCQKETLVTAESLTGNGADKTILASKYKPQSHYFKGAFTAYYNFIPDVAGGWVAPNPAPAWWPGGGQGHVNLLGKCRAFYNQYATIGVNGLQTVAAPVNQFFPVEASNLGIQTSDLVGMVFVDEKGNSIWSRAVGAILTTPVSETRIDGAGYFEIVGGTGKFANATGHYNFTYYFNPVDNSDAGFEVKDGEIVY